MDFESILEEILLGRGQGNLKLKGARSRNFRKFQTLIEWS